MDINLELYKVFYYVATTLSFSEASRQLFISQSAVSQAVKNLEKKLGHTLFVRSTKRVILTPEGELLLQHVKPALSMLNEGEGEPVGACYELARTVLLEQLFGTLSFPEKEILPVSCGSVPAILCAAIFSSPISAVSTRIIRRYGSRSSTVPPSDVRSFWKTARLS